MRPRSSTSLASIDPVTRGLPIQLEPHIPMHRSHLLILLLLPTALVAAGGAGCAESRSESSTANDSDDRIENTFFTDVTEEAGLGAFRHDNGQFGMKWFPEQMGAGGGFIDYDGDGWLDVLVVGGGVWPDRSSRDVPAIWMYRNNGDATFTLVTDEVGLGGIRTYSLGIAAADYDNDGDEDFYLTTLRRNMLFRNDGGRFTEVGESAGVSDEEVWSSSPIFFDADRDGWLDLYVGGYADWSPETDVRCEIGGDKVYCRPAHYHGIGSVFYHNNGDGTFTNRTAEAGFTHAAGKSLGVAEMDYNGDGWSDLVVVNDGEGDLLYENDGDGTFIEKGAMSGVAYDENGAARAGMGVDAGVVDTTDQVTIFVGNFSRETVGVYRHRESGSFIDRAAVSEIGYPTLPTLTFGLFLFDVELDGDLDLFLANGHVYPEQSQLQEGIEYRQQQQLFLNRGDGSFEVSGARGVFSEKFVARGAAYGDFDRDGDLDVLITENDGPAHLWRNDVLEPGPSGGTTDRPNYLRVHVEGRASNRDGLGTLIEAFSGSRRLERRIRTGSSYLSQNEKVATFGLGGEKQIDRLVVHWPSGRVEEFAAIRANQDIHIVEGEGTYTADPPEKETLIQ